MALIRRTVPHGYRFCPTNEELILDYLWNKVHDGPLPHDVILDEDVYKAEPWLLRRDFEYGIGSEVYYFSLAKRLNSRNSRKLRTAGNGHWHMNGRHDEIMVGGELVGHKTALKYFISEPGKKKRGTPWVMHEYRLHYEHGLAESKEMVLCRIQKTGKRVEDADQYHQQEPDAADIDEHPRKRSRGQEHAVGPTLTSDNHLNDH